MIFGIGVNKTATYSLAEALRTLGLTTVHDHRRMKHLCDGLRELTEPDDRFDAQTAYFDSPLFTYWQELKRLYPEARFILTTRDKEDWMRSRIIHVLWNRAHGRTEWTEINTRLWSAEWDLHHAAVREAFADSDRYLELDLCAAPGWSPLCEFLDVPVPHDPFPCGNTGLQRLRDLVTFYERRAVRNDES